MILSNIINNQSLKVVGLQVAVCGLGGVSLPCRAPHQTGWAGPLPAWPLSSWRRACRAWCSSCCTGSSGHSWSAPAPGTPGVPERSTGRGEEWSGDRSLSRANQQREGLFVHSSIRPSHLQEVAPAAGHHGSLVALEAVDHDHQVHVGVLLLDGAVAPGALHLIVCVLCRWETQRSVKAAHAALELLHQTVKSQCGKNIMKILNICHYLDETSTFYGLDQRGRAKSRTIFKCDLRRDYLGIY